MFQRIVFMVAMLILTVAVTVQPAVAEDSASQEGDAEMRFLLSDVGAVRDFQTGLVWTAP